MGAGNTDKKIIAVRIGKQWSVKDWRPSIIRRLIEKIDL
jgi:hypothetical protein